MCRDASPDFGNPPSLVSIVGDVTSSNGATVDRRIAQASGMVSVQADCTLSHAIALMESCAEQTDQTLEQIATAVLSREITFGI